ncbi:MAG: zinc finger-like domain-containing protein [Planctomycetes bacterium]|nr:zinc finger-like domain-containing protein [Planctomycetota bacterium]
MKTLAAALAFLLAALQDPPPKEPPPDPFVVKVSDMVRARWAAQVSQATGSKVKFEEAVAKAAKLEETIVAESAEKLGITPDEVRDAWKKREKKSHKMTFGDGSWVVLGGQDGGLDSEVKGRPVADTTDLVGGGPSILTRRKPPPPGEPVPLGKPLKTKDQWWATASTGERVAYVEGEFIRKTSMVEKKEESKKCSTCNGKGTLNVNRGGIGLTVICSRCHGTKDDVILVYE